MNSDESNSSNQEVISEDDDEEEDQSQIPDWNWLINNYEKNENKTEEMSSHEDDLEIDITPFMVKQRQKNQEREISSQEDQVSILSFKYYGDFKKARLTYLSLLHLNVIWC